MPPEQTCALHAEVMFAHLYIIPIFRSLCWGMIAVILCFASGVAQDHASLVNLRIRVIDSLTGRGVSDLTVTLLPIGIHENTDKQGVASFRAILPGEYRVRVSGRNTSTDAEATVVVREHESIALTVSLAIPHALPDSIIVQGRPTASRDVVVITQEEIRNRSAQSVNEVLNKQSGILLRENRNGDALLSINGSESRHVRILLNGQPIQQNPDGSTNLSAISIASVKEIRIAKGGSTSSSVPGALGGSIDIRTVIHGLLEKPSASLMTTHGDWGAEQYTAHSTLTDQSENLSATFDWQLQRQTAEFPFEYTAQPSPKTFTGVRTNNDFLSRMLSGSVTYHDFSLNLSTSESERGLPDRASLQNSNARTEDTRKILSAHWNRALALRSELSASLSYQESTNRAVDAITLPVPSRFDSRYETNMTHGNASLVHDIFNTTQLRASVDGSTERLRHEDAIRSGASLGKADRNSFGTALTIADNRKLPTFLYFIEVSSSVSARYDLIESHSERNDSLLSSRANQISPAFEISLNRKGVISPHLSAGAGSDWSAPSLTSLFWRRDARSEGNPSLKPEHANSSHAEIGIVLDLKHTELEATMRWHQTDYTDLVIWRPDFRGVFRPVNLASSKILGRSDHLSMSLLNRLFHFSYSNDLLDPRNRTTGIDFDQQLTFRPRSVTRIVGEVRTKHWEIRCSHEIVARRYATESNTRWYDAYHVTDIAAGFRISFSSFNIRLGGEVRNLFDQSYSQIAHYPMPGRNAGFSVRLSFDPTSKKK